MRNTLRRGGYVARVLATAVLGAASLGACTDQPSAAVQAREVLPRTTLQALTCDATRDGVTCRPQGAGSSGSSRVIYGGQNQFVRLTSANAGYNGGTGIYSVDVTVQNLMNEAIGTPDGVTPDPDGIQVFFYGGIIPRGTGTVTVANADGTAFFTEADQPYHAYHEILDKDEISQVKTWQFNMDPGVTGFSFTVLIETDVQYLLVINEVMVNPTPTSDIDQEWFEVYNAGTRPVQMQYLVIADSAASGRRPYHLINSPVEVASGGYVVLGGSTNTTLNGGAPVDYAYGGALALANSLDAVKIARVVGTDTLTVDRTQYSNAGTSAQAGISRELKNPALDNSNMDGSNWDNASVTSVYGTGGRGTPKAQNSTYTP
jgi:hypothetical protein